MDNMRGSILMVIAMLAFAIEDMFIKQMTAALPVGQILAIIGLGGGLACLLIATLRREPTFSRDLLHRSCGLAALVGHRCGLCRRLIDLTSRPGRI